jgi:dihydroneopterin aldolase
VDRILLEGMTFSGRHGVLPAEHEQPQTFTVDVALEADLGPAGRSDRLQDTVDYTRAHAIVREVVEGDHRDLLEAVAARIADRLVQLEGVRGARVRVAKRPPLPAFQAFAIEIERRRPA